jgi:hypothetical protein
MEPRISISTQPRICTHLHMTHGHEFLTRKNPILRQILPQAPAETRRFGAGEDATQAPPVDADSLLQQSHSARTHSFMNLNIILYRQCYSLLPIGTGCDRFMDFFVFLNTCGFRNHPWPLLLLRTRERRRENERRGRSGKKAKKKKQ